MEVSKDTILDLDQIQDVGIEYIEILFDSLLTDSVIKEIPVVRTIIALHRTGKSIKDYLFMKKIYEFLKNIQKVTDEKKDKFLARLNCERKENEVGIRILQIIDRLDEIKKAGLIGKLFVLLLEGTIDISVFFRASYIIDKCFYEDILTLRYFSSTDIITANNDVIEREVLENLYANGLLSEYGYDGGENWKPRGNRFGFNKYGNIIIDIIK